MLICAGVLDLSDEQLVTLSALRGSMMPDGKRYDGRFNLRRDIRAAGVIAYAYPEHPEDMAQWYGVSLEAYLAGQEWARENLPRLHREAGLAQDEAAETVDVPQPEEPQSGAPGSAQGDRGWTTKNAGPTITR